MDSRLSRLTVYFAILIVISVHTGTASAESGRVNVPAPEAPHEVPSQVCGTCHQAIYEEWAGSMHAKSTALHDPIHNAFYRRVMGDPTEVDLRKNGKFPICLNCHAPNAAIEQRTDLDAKPAFAEGVNCVACHTMETFHGVDGHDDGKMRLGIAAYGISTTHLQAPSGRSYSMAPAGDTPAALARPFHPFPMEGSKGVMQTSDACMGCHDRRENFHGVPLCATGDEIAASGTSAPCQACHMPTVNGHASHAMGGGHDENVVRRAVSLLMDTEAVDGAFRVTLTMNNKLPHQFPTGAPFRNAFIQLIAYDEAGEEIWKNYTTHPMNDDPKAMLNYTIGDGEGNPTMPPMAREVISDTRLAPGEERTLVYNVPSEGVVLLRAKLLYNLLWPQLVAQLDAVLTPDLKAAKVAAEAEQWF